jgi:hypothetical protein
MITSRKEIFYELKNVNRKDLEGTVAKSFEMGLLSQH